MLSSVLKCLKILKALWNVFPWQRGELEDLRCGKSRKWSDQRFVEIEPRKGSFNSQMRVRLRGRQIGLEAGEGIRRVIYHFSLGRDEDVTSIHTKEQGYFTSQVLSYLLSWQNATVTSSCTRFLSLASGAVYSHSFGLMALTSPSGLPQVGEDPLALCSYGDLCPPTSIIILAPDNGKLSLVFS